MTDINKQIDEEAKQILFKANKLPPEANYFGSVDHIKYSANEILKLSEEQKYSSRWRKVSEGHDIPYCTALLVRLHDGDIKVGYYLDHKYREDNFYEINDNGIEFLMDSIIEWKPID